MVIMFVVVLVVLLDVFEGVMVVVRFMIDRSSSGAFREWLGSYTNSENSLTRQLNLLSINTRHPLLTHFNDGIIN